MDASQRLTYLFYRYYEKNCTASEKDELFQLLQDPAHDETLRRLIAETWSAHQPLHEQSPQSADRILEYIIRHQPPVESPSRFSPSSPIDIPQIPRRRFGWVKYAAVFMLPIAVFLCFRLSRREHRVTDEPVVAAIKPVKLEDQCITLSDGSKVLLHKHAHIDFKPVFDGKTREVTLTGEAYFDIRHDARPFIVHTGNITTTVLGTAFNIDAHEKDLVITVVKGKVKVENNSGGYSILKRNEQVTVDVLHNVLTKTQVDAGAILTWKKPYLLFNDVSMKDAIAELAQRFHASITLTNPALENCSVTATFTQGEPLEQIIKVLSKINNMEYEESAAGVYELSGEGCK